MVKIITKKRICWENCDKLFFMVLYYVLLRWFPNMTFPVIGKFCKLLRYHCCRHIFSKCGNNVNIERGVLFGCGFDIEIGDNSGIGINCVVPSDIRIGSNVLMGPNVYILHFNHKFDRTDVTIKSQGYTDKCQTTIGNDVWIGRDVLFTPGRTVSDGTIIAARTCLCKDFPAYSLVGGNPSKLIRIRK